LARRNRQEKVPQIHIERAGLIRPDLCVFRDWFFRELSKERTDPFTPAKVVAVDFRAQTPLAFAANVETLIATVAREANR
jgi:hypothetical protein